MTDLYWFQKKWGTFNQVPTEMLLKRIEELEEKYQELLMDVKRLEEENISTTNELYRLENSLDARIDILVEKCGCIDNV